MLLRIIAAGSIFVIICIIAAFFMHRFIGGSEFSLAKRENPNDFKVTEEIWYDKIGPAH